MPRYLGVHKLTSDLDDAGVHEKGIHALSAVYNVEKGFAYCQADADSADQVREAHQAVDIFLEDVIEVGALE